MVSNCNLRESILRRFQYKYSKLHVYLYKILKYDIIIVMLYA